MSDYRTEERPQAVFSAATGAATVKDALGLFPWSSGPGRPGLVVRGRRESSGKGGQTLCAARGFPHKPAHQTRGRAPKLL